LLLPSTPIIGGGEGKGPQPKICGRAAQVQLKEVLRRVAVPPEKAAQQRSFLAK
jgi:hypothetical protein